MITRQKELEQQLQDEQLLYQELQEKYEKTCEKRDSMKNDMHQMQQQLEKTKADYKYGVLICRKLIKMSWFLVH